MGRKLKNLSELYKTKVFNNEEIFIRECPSCNCEIEYCGKSKRWNVQLAERKKTKCSKCQNFNQVPWNVGIPMKKESKEKSREKKIGKPIHSEEYKKWLRENSLTNLKGEKSLVIQKILEKENISYSDYVKNYCNFIEYEKKVYLITYQQPINSLKNSEKLRGRCGVENAYQLDHIISIKEGYEKKIEPEIIGSIENLQFIPWQENIKKSINYKKKKKYGHI
jgi:hypothetical protein